MSKKTRSNKRSWSLQDLQNFKDRNILKALTIRKKRTPPPDKSEWD